MLDRVQRIIPALYLAWALPLVLMLAWLTPPWENPDEPAHMLRVVQIAHGGLVGWRMGPGAAGGWSDSAVFDATVPLQAIASHPDRKVTLSMLAASRRVRWHDSLSALPFANTIQYPPMLYLPAAAATRVGEISRMSVDRTLELARGAGAVVAILLTAVALGLARRTRYALAAVAMLPMTCSLYASVSQDGLMIALSFLAVGWIDRIIERGWPAGLRELAALGAALGCVIMARPPYLPLVVLLFLGTVRMRWSAAFAVCAVTAAVLGWSALVASRIMVSFPQAEPTTQLALLHADPGKLVISILDTLRRNGEPYAREFIGQLGMLDTKLPLWYVQFAAAVVFCAFGGAAAGPSSRPWLPLFAVVCAAVLIFVVQYVTWTPAGADLIDGIQGRYFIPLAAALALAIPSWPRIGATFRPLAAVGLGALGVVTPFIVVEALVVRYYLAG